MLAASLNAFFCASPIYGSAEDFTFLLNVTVSREVTPAAKQQIGETRKKCNSDDRRLRRIQGGAVGAAVSRTRVPLKARSGRWAPQPVLAQRLAFFRFDNSFGIIKGEQPLIRASRASKVAGAFLVLFWRAKRLSLSARALHPAPQAQNHSSVICPFILRANQRTGRRQAADAVAVGICQFQRVRRDDGGDGLVLFRVTTATP